MWDKMRKTNLSVLIIILFVAVRQSCFDMCVTIWVLRVHNIKTSWFTDQQHKTWFEINTENSSHMIPKETVFRPMFGMNSTKIREDLSNIFYGTGTKF